MRHVPEAQRCTFRVHNHSWDPEPGASHRCRLKATGAGRCAAHQPKALMRSLTRRKVRIEIELEELSREILKLETVLTSVPPTSP